VRIAAFEIFEPLVTGLGLEFYLVHGDISKVAGGEQGRQGMAADNPLKLILSFNKLKSLVFDLQKDFFDACSGADAVVYHPGATIGYFAAQQLKIPSIFAPPFPMTPTRAYPALIFYTMPRLGGAFNLIGHKLFEQIMWMGGGPVKQFWKQQFGHSPAGFGCPFPKQNTRRLPTIISCSPSVFPRPADWPEAVYNPGYWFLEEDEGWQPPVELLDFLQRGTKPVYVGFGSIGNRELAGETTALVIDALQKAGQRGVLATGWGGLAKMEQPPEDIFILESAPHSWLFPRMAAVVHHGGAGTTAAGLKAGVPGIVIPYGNDTLAWGLRVYELGVGAKPIPRKNFTAGKLADAIRFVLTDEIKTTARILGLKIQQENGAAEAAKIIIASLNT
jgi:sterol 3beta-glucosyltransferase